MKTVQCLKFTVPTHSSWVTASAGVRQHQLDTKHTQHRSTAEHQNQWYVSLLIFIPWCVLLPGVVCMHGFVSHQQLHMLKPTQLQHSCAEIFIRGRRASSKKEKTHCTQMKQSLCIKQTAWGGKGPAQFAYQPLSSYTLGPWRHNSIRPLGHERRVE